MNIPIEDQKLSLGNTYSFTFPSNTFIDEDEEDEIYYAAYYSTDNWKSEIKIKQILSIGSSEWITFDPSSRSLYGTPQITHLIRDSTGASQEYQIKICATDNIDD